MKHLLLLLLTFLLARSAFGQWCLVSDNDGFVNVRRAAESKSRIIDTLNNGHFIYFFEVKPANWIKIQYIRQGVDREGYIYHDRLTPIDKYDLIPLLNYNEKTATLTHDSVKLIVTQQNFDKTKYRISYSKDHWVEKINGKQYWGTDGEMPKSEYKSMVIFCGSRRIELPRIAFSNLFEPSVGNTEVYFDRQKDIFYIRAQNSDGAGAYDVIWRVVRGVYTDRDIEYGF